MSDPFNPISKSSAIQAHKGNFVNKYLPKDQLLRPSLGQRSKAAEFTADRLEEIVDHKTFISQKALAGQVQTKTDSEYVKFTSKSNPNDTKLVRIQEVPEDPFAPPQFKTKRIPQGPGSPPRTILRSPPRTITQEDQKNWRIPPCVSNYKNKGGFVVPLEMRLAADGRTGVAPTINENFAKFSAALYASEKALRKELEEKERLKQQLAVEDFKRAENQIREKALLAKQRRDQMLQNNELSAVGGTQADFISRFDDKDDKEIDEAERKRNEIRAMIRRENVRNLRMESMGSKMRAQVKDRERDITERIALGEDVIQHREGDLMVDHRLLNGEKGVNRGNLDEDQEDIYDRPLFKDQEKINLYAGVAVDGEIEKSTHFDVLKKGNADNKRRDTNDAHVGRRNFEPIQFQKDDNGASTKRIKE